MYILLTSVVTNLAPLYDLEALCYLTNPGRQSRAARHKPQELCLLFISEGSECLPEPLYQLILLINPVTIPDVHESVNIVCNRNCTLQ